MFCACIKEQNFFYIFGYVTCGTCSFSVQGYMIFVQIYFSCKRRGAHSHTYTHRIMYGNGTHDCWKLNKTLFFPFLLLLRFYIFFFSRFHWRGIMRMVLLYIFFLFVWKYSRSIVSNIQFAIKTSIQIWNMINLKYCCFSFCCVCMLETGGISFDKI